MDDIRTRRGLLNQSDAARFLDIRQQTFNRWARGYERGRPLLHVLPPAAPGRRPCHLSPWPRPMCWTRSNGPG